MGLVALLPLPVQADEDNVYSRLKELRLEQQSPPARAERMGSGTVKLVASETPPGARGVSTASRSNEATEQEQGVWHRLGGISGIDTN
jgi:hypothetical protein